MLLTPLLSAFSAHAADVGAYTTSTWYETTWDADGNVVWFQIHYPSVSADFGADADPSGGPYPLIGFMHGYLGQAWMYQSACDAFASMGFVVVNADDAPWTVMGHSMGGIAMASLADIDLAAAFRRVPAGCPLRSPLPRAARSEASLIVPVLLSLWACGPAPLGEPDLSEHASEGDPDAVCDASPGVPGEDMTLSMEWEGRTRTWNVHVPGGYDCTPTPVIVGLHYYTGTAENFEHEVAQIHEWLDEHGVIGIFPNAMARGEGADDDWVTAFNDISSHNDDGPDGATCEWWAADYGVFDDCPASESERECFWGTSCADDVGFVRAVLEQASADWTVDPDRIHLTGFSQGAIATQTWAYYLQDVLASVAPLHGFAANGHTQAPTGDVSLMQVWGTYDYFIDGWDEPSADGLIYDGAAETAAVWAESQGCSAVGDTPYTTTADGKWGWSCTQHADCAAGTDVVTCQWDWTHDWGRDGADNFMWDAVWEFFEAHPRV